MERDDYILLIYKNLDNEISETELNQLQNWLSKNPENQALAEDLALAYDSSADYLATEATSIDLDAAFTEQLQLIKEETPENVVSIDKNKPKSNRLFWLSSAAVAAIVLLIVGLQFGNLPPQDIVSATTDKSEVVILPDGSEVTVYPNSQIKYKSEFTEGRFVALEKGKAKFDVVKGRRGFFVNSINSGIAVLGTVFTVETKKNIDKLSVEEQNRDLKTIVQRLNTTFESNISINSTIENCRLTISFENQPLAEILVILDKLLNTTHRKTDNGIEILGDSCE